MTYGYCQEPQHIEFKTEKPAPTGWHVIDARRKNLISDLELMCSVSAGDIRNAWVVSSDSKEIYFNKWEQPAKTDIRLPEGLVRSKGMIGSPIMKEVINGTLLGTC
jgi:hypothetical protein